jgi:hypothetical protein
MFLKYLNNVVFIIYSAGICVTYASVICKKKGGGLKL